MTISKKRLAELAARKDDQIDYSDIPVLDKDFWTNARPVVPDRTKAVTPSRPRARATRRA